METNFRIKTQYYYLDALWKKINVLIYIHMKKWNLKIRDDVSFASTLEDYSTLLNKVLYYFKQCCIKQCNNISLNFRLGFSVFWLSSHLIINLIKLRNIIPLIKNKQLKLINYEWVINGKIYTNLYTVFPINLCLNQDNFLKRAEKKVQNSMSDCKEF